MIEQQIIVDSDKWLDEDGPKTHIVLSSRSRMARNIEGYRLRPTHAKRSCQAVAANIDAAIQKLKH